MSQKHKILIVEDDPDVLSLLIHAIEAYGYQVSSAVDGTKGLAALHAEKPDLLVLDFAMPDISGLQVLNEIRKTYTIKELPAIMVTALDTMMYDISEIEQQANYVLGKPVRIDELMEKINECLGQATTE